MGVKSSSGKALSSQRTPRATMKQPILKTNSIEWRPKLVPAISPDRRGLFQNLSELHGLTQFEARLTRIPPGEASTWYHTHTLCEEWFYVLRGSCHIHLNGKWNEIVAGDSIATAPGDFHIFRNFGAEDCDLIMVGINHPDDKAERREEPAPPAC
jgi:uncharacterized cupin superfamily protein